MIKNKIFILFGIIVLYNSFVFSQSLELYNQVRTYNLSDNFDEVKESVTSEHQYWKFRYNKLVTGLSNISEEIIEKHDKNDIYINLILGEVYLNNEDLNNYDSIAYNFFKNAYNMSKENRNGKALSESLKHILQYHFKNQQNLDHFEKYSREYLQIAYDDFEQIVANYYWLGVMLSKIVYKKEKISNFLTYAENTLKIAKENSYSFYTGRILQLVGVYYDIIELNEDRALEYYNEALNEYDKINFHFANSNKNDLIFNIGALHLQNNQSSEALRYFRQLNLDIISQSDYRDKLLIYDNLYKTYKKSNSLDSALYFLEKKYHVNDSIGFYQKGATIAELETKYQTAEKEKQLLQEQQRTANQRSWLVAAGVVLLLGTGLAITINKNTSKKRLLAEQEVQLKQQRVENLLKEQELVSIDAMIAGQEKERQKVALELHDDLGSLMATIKLHFDKAEVKENDKSLKNAKELLEEAYVKVRGIAHAKNSGVMSNHGLIPAVEKMADVISKTNGLKLEVEHYGMVDRLENSLELTIFRIIQELITNILKHAEASEASIQLTQHDDNLNIIVADNGNGFDYTMVNTDDGMGLTNIEKRIEHLEGTFSIDSVVGKGTSILIDIPV